MGLGRWRSAFTCGQKNRLSTIWRRRTARLRQDQETKQLTGAPGPKARAGKLQARSAQDTLLQAACAGRKALQSGLLAKSTGRSA